MWKRISSSTSRPTLPDDEPLTMRRMPGILISRTIGLAVPHLDGMEPIHMLASHLSLILIGLHVALHWKWIVTHVQKYLFPARIGAPSVMSPVKQTVREGEL